MAGPANAYIQFYRAGSTAHSFEVLAGQNPPTITGGYATWNPIDRPLQRALTVFSGYEPTTMTADVIFGTWLGEHDTQAGWQVSDTAGQTVEGNIRLLEQMGGGNLTAGPPPIIYVTAQDSSGGQSDLIPSLYQTAPGSSKFPWVISGIEWGQAWRNATGAYRIYQEATVTLTEYLSESSPQSLTTTKAGDWFVSSAGHDTALRIAAAKSVNSPVPDHQILASRILGQPQNNPCRGTTIKLARRATTWTIRHGVHVWVPSHTVS